MPTNPIVILTRESRDNYTVAEQLTAKGIPVMQYPCIQTTTLPFGTESHLPQGMSITGFHTIVFTSKRGVWGLADAAHKITAAQQIAVVGETTAAAVSDSLQRSADLIADPQTGEALARRLVLQLSSQDRVLHVRGNKTTGTFKRVMNEHDIQVTELVVYHNRCAGIEPLKDIDNALVVFASPSAARCFFQTNTNKQVTRQWSYLGIGPTTLRYFKKEGLQNIYEVSKPGNLVGSIVKILGT